MDDYTFENKEMDQNTFDFSDEINTDLKVRPNYFIAIALLKAQQTLATASMSKDSILDAMIPYCVFIEHIEMLIEAAGYLDEEYRTEINNFLKGEELKITPTNMKNIKLANKKLGLLMREFFKRAPSYFALSDKGRKKETEKEISDHGSSPPLLTSPEGVLNPASVASDEEKEVIDVAETTPLTDEELNQPDL